MNKFSLESNLILNTKSYVTKSKIDKSKNINIHYCNADSTSVNTLSNCIIQNSDTLKYIRRATFLLDTAGQTQQLLVYHTEGVVSYTKQDLIKDTAIIEGWKINLKGKNVINLDLANSLVVDNSDSLKILDHWPKQKFIFVEASSRKNQKDEKDSHTYYIIYSYK